MKKYPIALRCTAALAQAAEEDGWDDDDDDWNQPVAQKGTKGKKDAKASDKKSDKKGKDGKEKPKQGKPESDKSDKKEKEKEREKAKEKPKEKGKEREKAKEAPKEKEKKEEAPPSRAQVRSSPLVSTCPSVTRRVSSHPEAPALLCLRQRRAPGLQSRLATKPHLRQQGRTGRTARARQSISAAALCQVDRNSWAEMAQAVWARLGGLCRLRERVVGLS